MYTALLAVHSWFRWIVIFAGVAAFGGAVGGLAGKRRWQPIDDLRLKTFTISLDVQTLVGLVLYAGLSPVTASGFADMGVAMRDPILRFYTVEHLFGMMVALALAHIGRARVRKAADDARRHRTALVFVGLAMVALVLSIPWPGTTGGRVLFRGL